MLLVLLSLPALAIAAASYAQQLSTVMVSPTSPPDQVAPGD